MSRHSYVGKTTALTLVRIAAAAAIVSGAPLSAQTTPPVLDVDLSSSIGSVTYGASGSLFAVADEGRPGQDKLSGIKLQSTGQMPPDGAQHPDGDANKIAPQFFRHNGKELQVYIQDFYVGFPYPNPGLNAYLNTVTTVVNSVKNQPNADKYVLVPFNEPDAQWYSNNGQGLINLQNDWKTVYLHIRSLWPEAKILGPAFAGYSASAYSSFFTFAKNNNVLPNVTAWHELFGDFDGNWWNHYNHYRSVEDSLGIPHIPININEYGSVDEGDVGVPGRMIKYVARLDAARVAGNQASWDRIGDMGMMLTPNFEKASVWYLFRWYGEQTGNSMRVTPPSLITGVQGTASLARTGQQASVIFGGASGNHTVRIRGLGSTSMGSTVRVTLSTLQNSQRNPSSGPTTTVQADYSVVNGQIAVAVPNMDSLNAYQITVTAGAGNQFDPNRLYKITNVNSSKVLDDYDHGTVDRARIDQWDDGDGQGHQRFYLVNEGGGYYKIVNGYSGKSLDIEQGSTADLAPVIQWTWAGADNQLWRFVDRGNGRFSLIAKHSNKVLDVFGASTGDGAAVGQYSYNGAPNQLWTIQP